MYNDPNWFFTDEPVQMWGRQLVYHEIRDGDDQVITPDNRRYTSLRRAFALYRVGLGDRGPGDEQLDVMRRTLSWLHCRRYEQPVIEANAKCPASARHEKVDDRRVICDVFGGSRPLLEHYLLHLDMLGLTTLIDRGDYGLTREGQAALIMLELTRPRSGVLTSVRWLIYGIKQGKWISVDPNRWANGIIAIEKKPANQPTQ